MSRVLYLGPDYLGSNGTCWRDALVGLGQEVTTVDCEAPFTGAVGLASKVRHRIVGRPSTEHVETLNRGIVAAAAATRPHYSFFVQARYVTAETLAEVRRYGPAMVYMNDDMFNRANQTFTFHETLPLFDLVLTTKTFNVAEFYAAGAQRVVYLPNAYDPNIHYPAMPTLSEKAGLEGDLALIGTFRPDRADFISKVARGVPAARCNVWGGGWGKIDRPDYFIRSPRNWKLLKRIVRNRSLWGQDLGKAIQSNKITLGLLNRANRDLHTSRSFEIPACGGFMLAERTSEHLEFFTEDTEAVYFESIDELVDKAEFYLRNDTRRHSIAAAALSRCRRSPYRYTDRARLALELLNPVAA